MRRLLIFFHAKSFHVRLALALLLTAFSGYALAGSWAKVADGYGYTFALKSNGTLWAAGQNGSGQLGNGSTAASTTYTQVLSGVRDVSVAQTNLSFAIKTDDTLWAAGGSFGSTWTQIATNVKSVNDGYTYPTIVKNDGSLYYLNGTTVTLVSGITGVTFAVQGISHAFAIKTDNTLWRATGIGGAWSQIQTGVKAINTSTWGWWPYNQALTEATIVLTTSGDVSVMGAYNGTSTSGGTDPTNIAGPTLSGVSAIYSSSSHTTGGSFSFALKTDGTLWAIGSNGSGQTGNGTNTSLGSWTQVLSNVASIPTGNNSYSLSSSAVLADGSLVVTGSNSSPNSSAYALGLGDTTDRIAWVKFTVSGLTATKGTVNGSVDLSWTDISSGTGTYEIWRSNGLNGTKSKIDTTTSTTYSDTTALQGVTTGTVYGYYVKRSDSSQISNLDYGYRTPATTTITGTSNFVKVSAGDAHSLALKSDGRLFAAGANGSGQLGDGTTITSGAFKQVLTGIQDIIAGTAVSFALKADGTLWVAGSGYSSTWTQILSGVSSIHTNSDKSAYWAIVSGTAYTGTNASNWAATTYTGIKQITNTPSSGTVFTLKTDGSLYKDTTLIGSGFKQIQSGQGRYCYYGCAYYPAVFAVKTDNTLWAYGITTYLVDGLGPDGLSEWHKILEGVQDISIFSKTSVNEIVVHATKTDGTVWATSNISYGQYGDGSSATTDYWKQVFDNVTYTSVGAVHAIALRSNGTIWVTGQNASGQLGLGDTTNRLSWTQYVVGELTATKGTVSGSVDLAWSDYSGLSGSYDIYRSNGLNGTKTKIATTTSTTYSDTTATQGVTSGIVYGYYIQSASGQKTNLDYGYRTPATTTITGTGNFVKVSAGDAHSLALKSDGRLFAAGANASGQLGDGTTITSAAFKQVLNGVQDVLAGTAVSFALKTDGTLWVAGNGYSSTWTQILSGVSSIHTNSDKSAYWAIISGTAYAGTTASNWAATTYTGIKQITSTPSSGTVFTLKTDGSLYKDTTLIGSGFKQIQSGQGRYCYYGCAYYPAVFAVKTDNTLWAYGITTYLVDGLGPDGLSEWHKILEGVQDISIFSKTSVNEIVVHATKTDGTLWATSNISYGQYGDGSSATTDYWKQVFDNVTYTSVGAVHAIALRSNGTIWVTGQNASGQLGLGDTTNRLSWTQYVVGELTATKGTVSGSVDLAWSDYSGLSGSYDIYRSNGLNGTKTKIATTTSTTYSDTTAAQGVTSGIVYGYYIQSASGQKTNLDYGYRTPATTTITGTGNFVKVSAGDAHSLALKSDGRLFAAGANASGQLGDGTATTSAAFKQVLTGVQDILAGTAVSFALKADGTLWVAGSGYSSIWTQILSGVSSLHTNNDKSVYWAIVSGTAYTGTNASNWAATTYTGIKQITNVTTGGSSGSVPTFTLKTDGSLYQDTTLIGTGFTKIQLAEGKYCYYYCTFYPAVFAIKSDSTLWVYGMTSYVADGSGPDGLASWHKILEGVQDIAIFAKNTANEMVALATKTDGTVWATSNIAYGQYGDGTSTATDYWKQVIDNVTYTSLGSTHALALRTNGTIWVTGQNASKQHGLNDTTNRTTWTQTGFITPGKVTGVNATDGTIYAKVNISWTADPDATQYDVYRSTASGTKGSTIATNLSVTTYDDTTVSGGTHYFYTIVAKNPIGSGPDSNQDEGWGKTPATLSTLNATQGTVYNKVSLSWTPDPDANSYTVWRSATSGGTATQIGTVTVPTATFDDATVSGGTHYFYTVKTVVGSLTGSASNEAQGWSKLPAAINSLTATQGTLLGKVILAWTSNPDATGYEVWRSTTSGGTATKIATVTAPASGTDDATAVGVSSYFYTVKTVVGSLTSGASNEYEGWADGAPTAATVTLTASSTSASSATGPTVTDPNVTAGKTENFTIAITTQPDTGTLTMVGNKFVYSPPADGLFSGPLTFGFTVTDKAGQSFTATGNINVVCGSPTITAFTLPLTSVQQASLFQANGTFSMPVCSTNSQIKVDVLDSNSVVVVAGTPITTPNGASQAQTFTSQGIVTPGSYTVRMIATSDSGTATKTAALTIKAINLPSLSVDPGLSVTVGEETVTATLSNPAVVNCPFTNDVTLATAELSKCYVVMVNPPTGMTIDNSGTLPSMSGTIEAAGSFPITAEVYKHDGTNLIKIGQVSKTVVASCTAPAITTLDIPALLPYEIPNYGATYKAYSCNSPLTGSLTIKKGTTIIETKPLSSLDYGAAATLTMAGTGLPTGNYTAELSIIGSSGTGGKVQSFQVKTAPMPTLMVSPTTVSQGETRVDVGMTPSTDTSCPLTTDQSVAQANPKKCYIALTTSLPDMTPGTDSSGLPIIAGYPATVGDYTVQAVVSRWVNGTRYDSDPLTKNVKVTPVVAPTFAFTGKSNVYTGIEKASLIFRQDSGTTCNLYDDSSTAQTEAVKGKRACFVNFTGDTGLTKTLSLNQFKLEGTLTTVGTQTLGYTVKRQFADGLTTELQTGELPIIVNDLPPPIVTFKGGYKITEGKYYVPLGQAITRATITAGVPTNAKMKITVTDSQQSFERGGVMNGGSYWISTPSLGLLEERPVTLRVAWQDYPTVYNEQVITAIGGTENNMKLVIDAPQKIADTDMITVKVNVGKYTKTGVNYTPDTMGQWRTQILAQSNTQSVKTPITNMVDMTDGVATFQINPAGNLFLKLTAVAELISTVDGLDTTLNSSTRYVEVVKGSPIVGSISSKALDGPAPKTFTLNLDMTVDNRVALKEVAWEESSDDGVTWTAIEKSNTIRHNVAMQDPGRRQVRAKMINKNTQVESYTTPVEVWAYSLLDANIVGPRHMAPGYTATLAAELYKEGVLTTNTVNEWKIEAPSGTTTTTGVTTTITEDTEGKIYVTLRSRPADTRADDPNAWSVARHYLVIKTPTRPSISAKGPRDVETGKTYSYEGTVRPSWGSMISVHTTHAEWQLPGGTTVDGINLDWTPTALDMVDTKPLIFRAWVDGFKDTTTSETTVTYVPWEYVWPTFSMSMKQLTIQAPSDLILLVNHDHPEMNRRFEGLAYEWSFPSGVTGRQNDAFPNRAMAQALYAGEYDVNVTIRDARGNQTVLTQHIVAEQAVPYNVTLKVGKSNYFDRAPMTITVRPTIYGGHPLDSVIAQSWSVDGVSVDDFANRSFMVKDISDAGNHTISYTLNSKMGETAMVNVPLFLVANQLPICDLTAKPNAYVVYAEAKCTDPDGKVIGYSWQVNGQPIGSTSYRISFSKTGTPQSANVTITAMDDAKELSIPVSINIDY